MTITTLSALQAALPGRTIAYSQNTAVSNFTGILLGSWWTPSGGATPPTGSGAVPTSATAGALALIAAAAGHTLYLARARMWGPNAAGAAVLLDRLVHTSGLSGIVTTAQTINSAAVNRPDSTGADARAYLEWYSSTGSTAQAATVSYTNQSGVSGQSGSVSIPAFSASAQMLPIPLAAGDTGVRSVESITLAASTGSAGNFGVTIARQLAWIPTIGNNAMSQQDHFELGLPVIPANACLTFAGSNFGGSLPRQAELIVVEG